MNPRAAVIGAGLSGLACARRLTLAGLETIVFEKSRSFGGRCATRLWNGHVVDHGAQFFTMRDPAFESVIRDLCGDRVKALEAPVVDRSGQPIGPDETRSYHLDGNNRLGQAMAAGLEVRREITIEQISPQQGAWLTAGEHFDFVVLSAPWPQTAHILSLPDSGRYAPCLTSFFSYEGGGWGGDRYAVSDREHDLMWSACENHKQGRIEGDVSVFVVQASPAFSHEWLERDSTEWLPVLQDLLESEWQLPKSKRSGHFAHRWRFAKTIEFPDVPALPEGLFVTGDSLAESRLEDVWRHGHETAGRVLTRIGH